MKRFASMTAIALLATTPAVTALAQDDARAELNQEVYAEGMAELTGDGYDVETVRQDDEGSLTFMARNETNGRILIMDDDGDVVSDTMTDLNASTRIEFEGEGEDDDDGEASVMVGADTGIDVEADGENDGTDDESSASINIGSDTSIGVEADGDDGDDSASLGIDAGVDLGISADSDS